MLSKKTYPLLEGQFQPKGNIFIFEKFMNYIEETEFQSFRSWASTASPQDLLEAFRSACLDVKKAEGWFMGVLSKKYDKPHRYYVILKYELYKRLGAKVPEPTSFWL